MQFCLTQEISDDVYDKAHIITSLSSKLENHFSGKMFGPGIESIIVGIICVRKEFDFFFKPRHKYSKSKKLLEYDIKLNHELFSLASSSEIESMVQSELLKSLRNVSIKEFNIESFKIELEKYFTG